MQMDTSQSDRQRNLSIATRLPLDILSEIFVHTLESSGTLQLPPKRYGCPWVLRQVCSLWRLAALQEICLWSDISIKIGLNRSAKDFAYVREILPPRGPLSIVLHSGTLLDDVFEELVEPNLCRIIKLHLDVRLDSTSKIWTLPPASFPAVEALHLPLFGYRKVSSLWLPPEDIQFFQGMSHLKKFSVWEAYADFTVTALDIPFIPWPQLTHIDLSRSGSLEIPAVNRILIQSHALRSFAVRVENELGLSSSRNDIALPSLTSLTSLHLESGLVRDQLLLHLPWRQLKHLKIKGRDRDGSVHTILREAPCLETLGVFRLFDGLNPSADMLLLNADMWPEHPIVYEYLHTFMLDNRNAPLTDSVRMGMRQPSISAGALVKELLDSATMPRLKNLSISAGVPFGRFDRGYPLLKSRGIVDFIQRSKCSLTVFEYGFYITQNDLKILLPLLASLHEWRVINGVLDDAGVLVEKIQQGVLLPELRVFHTGFRSPEKYVELLESRVRLPQSSLRSGIGYFCSSGFAVPKDIMRRLDDLNAISGVNFIILTREDNWGIDYEDMV